MPKKVKQVCIYVQPSVKVKPKNNALVRFTGMDKAEASKLKGKFCWISQKNKSKNVVVIGGLWISEVFYAEKDTKKGIPSTGMYFRARGDLIAPPSKVKAAVFDTIEEVDFISAWKEKGIDFDPYVNQSPVIPSGGAKASKKNEKSEYGVLSRQELMKKCQERGIKGYVKKSEKEIIEMLQSYDEANEAKTNSKEEDMAKKTKKSTKKSTKNDAAAAGPKEPKKTSKKTKKSSEKKESSASDVEKTSAGYRKNTTSGVINDVIEAKGKITMNKCIELVEKECDKRGVKKPSNTATRIKAIVDGMRRDKGMACRIEDGKVYWK